MRYGVLNSIEIFDDINRRYVEKILEIKIG